MFVPKRRRHNVVSHASNLVTHLAVLLIIKHRHSLFSNVSKRFSSAWGGVTVGSHSRESEMSLVLLEFLGHSFISVKAA